MPQLKSGRHFALKSIPRDALSSGADTQLYYLIMEIRLSIHSAEDLLQYMEIYYFDPNGEGPPAGETIKSGFTIRDVLEQRSDWGEEEVVELQEWTQSPRVSEWLQSEWVELNRCIRESPVWKSDLVLGD